ncbi:hypothetical protein [Dactylosporangium maewongense]|uniref:hypothetical protein n=1 Tax=Dactylosporangium TaxID=35753 RepID=UPI0031E417E6
MRYIDADVSDGAVVGVLELVDERLETIARTPLRAAEPAVVAMDPGRYLAIGYLPGQGRLRATLAVPDRSEAVLTARPAPLRDRPTWLRAWEYERRGWRPSRGCTIEESGGGNLDVTVIARRSARLTGVQVGTDTAHTPILVVPRDTPLRIAAGEEPGTWVVAPPPDAATTLLQLLFRGQLTLAGVVADDILLDRARAVAYVADPQLLDLAVGYYLLRIGDPRAADWVDTLAGQYPDSVDATVLWVTQQQYRAEPDESRIAAGLQRASFGELPFVAEGLRLLITGLVDLPDLHDTATLRRLRSYLAALHDGPLTAFTGADPDRPGTVLPYGPPPGEVTLIPNSPPPAPTTATAPSAAAETRAASAEARDGRTVEATALALQALSRTGFDGSTDFLEVTAEGVVVAATVAPGDAGGMDVALAVYVDNRPTADLTAQSAALTHAGGQVLGVFDDSGSVRFRGVTGGRWRVQLDRLATTLRLPVQLFALPLAGDSAVVYASGPVARPAETRIQLPWRGLRLVLRQRERRYHLEVAAAPVEEFLVTVIEYGTAASDRVVVIVPVPTDGSPTSSVVLLAGFDPRQPWHVSAPFPAAGLVGWPAEQVRSSVQAAVTPATRDTWRSLAASLSDPHRSTITSSAGQEQR